MLIRAIGFGLGVSIVTLIIHRIRKQHPRSAVEGMELDERMWHRQGEVGIIPAHDEEFWGNPSDSRTIH